MPYPIVWLVTEVQFIAVRLGYWIRPFDMLADCRRWRWQRPAPCYFAQPEQWLRDNLGRHDDD